MPRILNKLTAGLAFFLLSAGLSAQNETRVKAVLNDSLKSLYIQQELVFHNQSQDTLNEIYLNDWMNAFSDTRTPLARKFFEDYDRDFHFAREEKRGGTTINSITDKQYHNLSWKRVLDHPDLIAVIPTEPVLPGKKAEIHLNYSIKIPSDDFTRYGYSNKGEYQLRYWFITPGMYRDGWQVYSHKNMNDLFTPPLDVEVNFEMAKGLAPITPLEVQEIIAGDSTKTMILVGKDRIQTKLHLKKEVGFEDFQVDNLHILTNIADDGMSPVAKHETISRIVSFLQKHLGPYPNDKLLSTSEDYAESPVYGLNQLPKFIRPFPEGFNYDLKQLKTITNAYLESSLLVNPRKDRWLYDALQTYLFMEYIEAYYPDLKVIGNLSEVFGIRWFNIADLKFNDQFPLLYLYMARQNLDQPLSTPQDSLIKFNRNLAGPSKGGVGLQYLEDYSGSDVVSESIKEFYQEYQLKEATPEDFQRILKENSRKDVDWFFEDYVNSKDKIDFRIKDVKKRGDSLTVLIKNKTDNHVPVPIYGLKDKEIVFKKWIENTSDLFSVSIPAKNIEKIALNHEGIVPEINRRDNYHNLGGFMNKALQFRLFKDVENPEYHQLFLMPEFEYNLYDGLALGAKIYNKALLDRNFEFQFAPLYGLSSETLVGGASISHQVFFNDDNLYALRYGISGNRFSYGYGLLYQTFTPFLSMRFRNSYLRNSRKERLLVRNVNVQRDQSLINPLEIPDYSVFNINYTYSNPGLVEHVGGSLDFQLAEKFSKASVTLEYKKLLQNDRQINIRFFSGAFLYNDLPGSDYFSFALDRPTDYLFDYNYYGRSETSGLFSQQLIMAEGGFKSMLEPEYANQWLTTVNTSTTIWKWIFAYADVGLVKNKNNPVEFLYDSGIRMSIIQNYFEIFFPVYSSEGWEFKGENYDQKIRFIATLDFRTLTGLFSREWF